MKIPQIHRGQMAIALVCVILGLMIAVQFRTTNGIRNTVSMQRAEDLVQRLAQTEQEKADLQKELKKYRAEGGAAGVASELQTAKMVGGLLAVHGPGVAVIIDDSKKTPKSGESANLYLIHDEDILKVVNELRAAAAEAIAINDQRLIATSEIRCAGPTLSVNNTRTGAPFQVKAIGDPKTLESALMMKGGVVETLGFWGIDIKVTRENDLTIPAYSGAVHFEYAKPVADGGAK